ncbi:MAG: GIY-YIG nuclease family protein [Chitinophagales bacterium]|nr:GIY-YIG nuclease family protein [Chitinophagales bacterium]
MFFAYVLKSIRHNYYYKGHCEDLEKWLAQHNSGVTWSTRPYIPFNLVYSEQFRTREEAIAKEKYFKSAAGRRFLKKILATLYNTRPADASQSGPPVPNGTFGRG